MLFDNFWQANKIGWSKTCNDCCIKTFLEWANILRNKQRKRWYRQTGSLTNSWKHRQLPLLFSRQGSIQLELTTESSYKGSYREKSIHFCKRLLSCGVIRLGLSKASYNYWSKCATKSHQSYFLLTAKSRERNDQRKPLRPYPSQCHLVLVGIVIHAAALCPARTRKICDQAEEDKNSWNDQQYKDEKATHWSGKLARWKT